jgi:hypothetical protein
VSNYKSKSLVSTIFLSYIYWDGFQNLEGEEQLCFMIELTIFVMFLMASCIRFELGIILFIIFYFLNKKDDFNGHEKVK